MRVALIQMAPVLLDRAGTLRRMAQRVEEAGAEGARLVAFGETLLPGYPVWLERSDGARFESDRQKDIYARYVAASVDIGAGELDPLRAAAARAGVFVVAGVAERDSRRGRSLFASAVCVGPEGEVLSSHRKLMPTYEERLTWTPGDAHGLEVHAFEGFRVGALNCWENWMPLPRAALHARGETLHVALWPGSVRNTEPITRFLAREGRSYVLSVSSVLRSRDVPRDFPHRAAWVTDEDEIFHDGGSCVAGPDGEWVVAPVGDGATRIVYADLDPVAVDRERQSFDPAGHYARPELLSLKVRTQRALTRDDEGA